MKKLFIAALLCGTLQTQAASQYQPVGFYNSLSQLLIDCSPYAPQRAQEICRWYIAGVVDTFTIVVAQRFKPDFIRCYQSAYPNVSLLQTQMLVFNYLKSHPKILADNPASTVGGIYLVEFPIPKDCEK